MALRKEIEDVFKKHKPGMYKFTQRSDVLYDLETDLSHPNQLIEELKAVIREKFPLAVINYVGSIHPSLRDVIPHAQMDIAEAFDDSRPLQEIAQKEATKHDKDKPRMGLISSIFLKGLADVLTFGAKKYSAHNWRKGFDLSRPYDALQRHLFDWNSGKNIDEESGLPVLDHAACELMFLRELWATRMDLDDRFVILEPNKRFFTPNLKLPPEKLPDYLAIELQGAWEEIEIEDGRSVKAFILNKEERVEDGQLPMVYRKRQQ